MLTREQAIEAAFYSGANLCSFTDERTHNLDWMAPDGETDRWLVKREAASIVLDAIAGVPSDETMVAIVVSALMRQDLVKAPGPGRWSCWRVFVAVLRSCAALMREEAERDAAARAAAAGPSTATASFADEEDRIDGRNPDPFARVTGAPELRQVQKRNARKN